MEYEIERASICKKCSGELKCTKMCEIHTCKAMINYLRNIDVIATKIGEFNCRTQGGKQDLVTSGHQVYGSNLDSGTILTDISTVLDATRKLSNAYNKTPVQILNSSKDELGITTADAQVIVGMLTKLNNNKLVIAPFKPETVCIVSTPDSYRSEQDMILKMIVWKTNKDTHKLEAQVKFMPKSRMTGANGISSMLTYMLSDYMDKFKIKALNMAAVGEKRDNSLISMTNYGMIKPIEVVSKGMTIAVDGTYVYSTVDNITQIIGAWNPRGELVIIDKIKSKALDKIMENNSLLKSHRKYIAPYKLHEANTLEV